MSLRRLLQFSSGGNNNNYVPIKIEEEVEVEKEHAVSSTMARSVVDAYENEMMGPIKLERQEEEEEENKRVKTKKKNKVKKSKKRGLEPPTEILVPTLVGDDPRVTTIADLSSASNAARLYRNHLQFAGRNEDEVIASIPKTQETMAHIATIPDRPFWFMTFMPNAINMGLQMPVLETVSFDYVADFLKKPSATWERPCKPHVDTKTGQQLICESVLMGGPVLKEYLLPSQHTALMQSPFFKMGGGGGKKTINLPNFVRCCFLCAQRSIAIAYYENKLPNEGEEVPQDRENIIIHDYIMAVGCNGGYNPLLMYPGFKYFNGIVGPVIIHDRNHYAPRKDGWVQRDVLRFQDGVTMLQ
jgi:hypothetical protein